jgi:hypothetical protein
VDTVEHGRDVLGRLSVFGTHARDCESEHSVSDDLI